MPRRILIVNQTGKIGGAELVLLDVVESLGPDRCHVVLFGNGPLKARLEQFGIGVTVLEADEEMINVRREGRVRSALTAVPAIWHLGWRLAKIARQYDVLCLNSQKAAVVTMLFAPVIRKPIVWHLHDILSAEHFAALHRFVVVNLANCFAGRVIANSEVTKESFIACGGDRTRVTVVLNGIDEEQFRDLGSSDVAAMRAAMGFGSVPLVGVFGRISPWKGQHVLIEALSRLPNVHAIIVGDALFGEVEYRDSLRELAERLGVAERIRWVGQRDDVPRLMCMVDIVVHASTSPEPFGRVIVEGILAGRPVIASADGASREILGDDYRWLVEPGNPALLAQAIESLLTLPKEATTATVRGKQERARRLFSRSRMTSQVDDVLERVI